jgi:multidrug efflux pump subunit AcrB
MKDETKTKGTAAGGNQQDLLDSTIKQNWLARVGVTKPYTVFVCVMAILILGVFAFTTLKTELFPNMNLPYAIVYVAADTEQLPDKIKELQDTWTAGAPADTSAPDYADKLAKYQQAVQVMTIMGNSQLSVQEQFAQVLSIISPVSKTVQLSTDMQSALSTVAGVKETQSRSMSGLSIIILEYQGGVTVDLAPLMLAINNNIDLKNEDKYGIKYGNANIMNLSPNMLPVYSFTAKGESEDWYKEHLLPELETHTYGVASVSSKLESLTNTDKAWLNGEETVSFTIQKSSDSTTTEVVANIIETLETLRLDNTNNFDYTPVLNQGDYINNTLGSVGENLIIGGVLAIAILFLFLRSVKMTLAIAISIPLAVIATFVAMHFAGIGLNIVSMSALALAVGMLVDNSIVVLENIYRFRQKGESIRESAIKGASQVMGAMVASTLTTICVFFPMFFLTGLIMEVFMDLVWVVIFSLACSLLVAVMFLPGIISSFHIDAKVKKDRTKEPGKFKNFFIKSWDSVKSAYDKSLNFAIARKWGVVGLALVLFFGSAALLFINGWTLMPSTDEGEFTASVALTDNTVDHKILADDLYTLVQDKLGKDLDHVLVEYSSGNNSMSIISGAGVGMNITVTLKDKRKHTTDEAAEEIYNALLVLRERQGKDYTDKLGDVTYSSTSMTNGMVADSVTIVLSSGDTNTMNANTKLGAIKDTVINKMTALDGVAKAQCTWSPTTITQINKRVVTTFEMKVSTSAKISEVQTLVDRAMDELLSTSEFDGMTTVDDGFAAQLNETYSSLGIAIGVGLILVYLVMVMMFQSFIMPLIVLICIPLAFTGAFVALAICGMPLSVPALIGFLILMGVIVNNGILAVDYTNQARRDGLNVKDALVAAMHTRMRPIFMTALTTILGLLPMAFNMSFFTTVGGAMMQPLAVVSIGGLLFGTLTTLLAVPAFYAIFCKDKKNPEEHINGSVLLENK